MKPRMTRRELVAAGTAGVALASVPNAWAARLLDRTPRIGPGDFLDGVASGEPSADAVTLWSRLATERPRSGATLIVAEDEGLQRVVSRTVVPTGRGINGTLKARIAGLEPRSEYFYKWISGTGESETGRTITAPAPGSDETLRIGFSSCQNFPFGFFAPMRDAVERDLDLKLFLGDYMYETARNGPVRNDPIATTDLASYREKYRLNRTDPGLRELHRVMPMAHIWDDHEVADNYNEPSENQDEPDQTNPGQIRQAAELRQRTFGYRAAFEWLPRMTEPTERHRIYRKLSYGGLVDIFLLDTRQYRTNGGTVRDSPTQGGGPGSPLLNPAQRAWLRRGLRESKAKWKIIAQQVVVATIFYGGAAVQNPDAWDGHQDERDEILDDIAGLTPAGPAIDNVVWLTGDVHAFIANQLPTRFDRARYASGQDRSVSTEYVGGSVTSVGIFPAPTATSRSATPWNEIYEDNTRGYGILDFTGERLNTDFRGAAAFPTAATPLTTLFSFTQADGANLIETVAPRQVRRRRRR